MKITMDQVRHVAQLARLSPSEEQMKTLMQNMNDILDYMDQLSEIDTSNVDATTHVVELKNVFREDEMRPSLQKEKSMKNAPEQKRDAFVVPRVI
jgi:aspartyl-tRNA(Asn)/glutamyl-tRNA(Gln) amidotransferase subunit C